MKLTNIKCKTAKPKEKSYKMFDGGGMYLEVMPNGSKYWRMKYRFANKEKRLAIGVYPIVSLAEARESRDDAKKLLHNKIDPSAVKKDQKAQIASNAENTFKAIAMEWYEIKADSWSDGYKRKIRQ